MKRSIALALSAALAACASHTEVIKLGQDHYMVGYQQRGGLDSWTELKAHAIQLASDYCQQQQQTVEVLDTKTSGVRGLSPQNVEITFTCRTSG